MFRIARFALMVMAAVLACAQLGPAAATQRSPGWWDPDGVGAGSDWHYRVPVVLPAASTVNSTAKVDIDFAALMTQLGISGAFDVNSVRVIRPGGAIATVQEYNDTIYAGATDASAARGEVRWIVEDGGTQTYYVHFDVNANGAKSANPQTPINGNFEQSSSGTAQPAGWLAPTKASGNFDAQVRPSETVSATNDQVPADGVNLRSTNGMPNTGSNSYLLGWRSSSAAVEVGAPGVTITRTFTVHATNPGNLVVRWKPEGWDAEAFDFLTIKIVGTTTTTVVTGLSGNFTTKPAAPNYGNTGASSLSPGFRQYNGFDCDLFGIHHFGMSGTACHSEPWFSDSQSLAAYAGQSVTLSFTATQDNQDKTWFLIDDIEWSVVSGTLGSAEGFGVAATSPAGSMAPGQVLTVKAVVDAKPTAATNPVTADIVNNAGTTVASGVKLYNDGTHGDTAANDATWTNNGSDGANPTYTIPIASGSSAGWTVRVYGRDASTSTQGQAGMVHRNGQGTTLVLANWWNIDEQTFNVDAANIGVTKAMTIISDGYNGTNFKAIPVAQLKYCVTISNSGTANASTVVATDSLPATLGYVPGSLTSGADCAGAATAEDDDASGADETDPIGASASGSTVTITRATLATSGSFAVTYRVTVS